MATCPACGRRLHLWNWKQFCPSCNVNLVYYKANERLLDESEKAEIEHAAFQPRVDRGKAAFFGSPLAIIRIVLTFLPLGAVFLPLATLHADKDLSVNAISVYNFLTTLHGADNLVEGLKNFGAGGNFIYPAIVLTLLSVVFVIVNLLSLFAALGKHHFIRHLIFNGIQTFSAVGAAVLVAMNSACTLDTVGKSVLQAIAEDENALDLTEKYLLNSWGNLTLSWGAFVLVGVCAALLIWNIFLHFHGIPVKYKECLIGGLPKEEYYALVEQGLTREEIRRKMLVALTDLQIEAEKAREEEKQKEEEERSRRK